MGLFVPFTPKAQKTEAAAVELKAHFGLGPYTSADPHALLPWLPARLIEPDECALFSDEARAIFFGGNRDEVSALALFCSPADGKWLIYVNPGHHIHRQRASLMEEVVHIALDHPLTEVTCRAGVRQRRTYHTAIEDEAFDVGAACIMPFRGLFFAVKKDHMTVAELAEMHNVSTEYVVYRIKRAGLANVYKANVGPLVVPG